MQPISGLGHACRAVTGSSPLVSGPTGGDPIWGRRGVVLTGAALWYLKRGYPLYVHFINGEYTGGDSYLRIKLTKKALGPSSTFRTEMLMPAPLR